MLSSEAGVDSYALRSGKISEQDWQKIAYATSKLYECDILIDPSSAITVTGMKAKARRVKNLGLVVVDYLQLMQSDRRSDSRVLEVGDISRGLKAACEGSRRTLHMLCSALPRTRKPNRQATHAFRPA